MEDIKKREEFIDLFKDWANRLEFIVTEIDSALKGLNQYDDSELMLFNECDEELTNLTSNLDAYSWGLKKLSRRFRERILEDES